MSMFYVALAKFDEYHNERFGGPLHFRSPIEEDEEKVNEWIKSMKERCSPFCDINRKKPRHKMENAPPYNIFYMSMSFSLEQRKNVELFLMESGYAELPIGGVLPGAQLPRI